MKDRDRQGEIQLSKGSTSIRPRKTGTATNSTHQFSAPTDIYICNKILKYPNQVGPIDPMDATQSQPNQQIQQGEVEPGRE